MLTVVNMLGIALIISQALVKPFKWLIRALQRKHVHDGELRGIKVQQVSSKGFKKYFERLCLSGEVEAGWERIPGKNFGKSEAKGRKWLEENGNAVCDWRCRYVSKALFCSERHDVLTHSIRFFCSSGDGPLDTYRVKFTVEGSLTELFENAASVKVKSKTTIQQYMVGECSDEYDQCYMAVSMPFLIPNRDFVVERFHERERRDGSMMTAIRSIDNDEVKSRKESSQLRRVRATNHAYGYVARFVIGRQRALSA